MAASTTTTSGTQVFLQYPIFTRFILPFLLVFTLSFAILEKTKLLGEGKKQINAIISFVISLIFVTVLSPTEIVSNLMIFLSIALVIVFVIIVLWNFLNFEGGGSKIFEKTGVKVVMLIILLLAVIIGVIWAFGVQLSTLGGNIISSLFGQSWSGSFWTNALFAVLIAVALALVIGRKAKGSS